LKALSPVIGSFGNHAVSRGWAKVVNLTQNGFLVDPDEDSERIVGNPSIYERKGRLAQHSGAIRRDHIAATRAGGGSVLPVPPEG
jgi:hypothetical protein